MPTALRPLPVVAGLLLAVHTAAFGFGFRLGDQDAAATARGLAFTATADNPSAIFYNPAGITQVDGLTARLGAYGIQLKTAYTSPAGDTWESKDNFKAVPVSFITYKADCAPVAVGLGVYAPWGLSLKFRDDVPFRTLAREGMIRFLTVNPVVAVQVTRTLALALGATLNYAQVELQRGLTEPGDNFRFAGSGIAMGFNAGLLWKPAPQHAFGLRYHAATPITFSGHSRATLSDAQRRTIGEANEAIRTIRDQFGIFGDGVVEAALASYGLPAQEMADSFPEEDAHAKVHFPQIVTAGYSFRPWPDWNFEFNIDWTDWDSLNTVTLHNAETGAVGLPFNYQSSFLYSFGVTKEFAHNFRVSCGYIYSENSVPQEWFSPAVPDGLRHVFSIGLGQKTPRYTWDLAYQYSYAPARTIANGTPADGTYDFSTHAVTLSFGVTF